MLNMRIQNDRDRVYCFVSNDDYDIVKGRLFSMRFVGRTVILRNTPDGSTFRNRWARDGECTGYKYAVVSQNQHPFFPLFGPFHAAGLIQGNDIYINMPDTCLLPWPSTMAYKYQWDDDNCEAILNQRANDMRRLNINVMTVPDHMLEYIGFERFADFLERNPWITIEREKQKEAA